MILFFLLQLWILLPTIIQQDIEQLREHVKEIESFVLCEDKCSDSPDIRHLV